MAGVIMIYINIGLQIGYICKLHYWNFYATDHVMEKIDFRVNTKSYVMDYVSALIRMKEEYRETILRGVTDLHRPYQGFVWNL